MGNQNLKSCLKESLTRNADSVAMQYIRDGNWVDISYKQLEHKIDRYTDFLRENNIGKGDRAVILLENSPEWGAIFLACQLSDIVVVPIYAHSTFAEISNIVNDAGVRALFTSEDLGYPQDQLLALSSIEKIFLVNKDGQIDTRESDASKAIDQVDLSELSELSVIIYTSGTTSDPKGVMLTQSNLYSNFHSLNGLKMVSSSDSVLSLLPLHHAFPLMVTLLVPVLAGARVAFPPSDWPDKLTQYAKEVDVSILMGVPQIYNGLHRKIKSKLNSLGLGLKLYINAAIGATWFLRRKFGINLTKLFLPKLHKLFGPSLRFFVTGGAKIDSKVERDLFKWGFTVLEGYGLTETSPAASFNPVEKPVIGSIGIPIPNVEIKVENKDDSGVGELLIKGPNIMKGYYNKESATKEVLADGWFRTGDLGYIDKDGYIFITGRSKELIVLSSGKNVYPQDLESEYSKTPLVKEICILGVSKESGAKTQDYLYGVVVPDLDSLQNRGEMNVYDVIKNRFEDISKSLPTYNHLMGFTIISEPLPRTILGKVKRHEVQARYAQDIIRRKSFNKGEDLSREDEKILESDTARELTSYLKENFNIKDNIYPNSSIEIDLGIDSLARTELLSAMERTFNINLPDGMVATNIFTVKDLITQIDQALESQGESGVALESIKSIPISELLKQGLTQQIRDRIELDIGIFDWIFTFCLKTIILIFFKLFYRLKVEGGQNIPKDAPYIICPNHVSFFDGFIIMAAVPFHCVIKLFFMGFRKYFNIPVVRSCVKRARIIPIDATEILNAMQAAYFILNNKKALCIFPEGERSIDGEVQRFKKGIGIISNEMKVNLVPTRIEGAFEVWPRAQRLPRFGKIKVIFGKPVSSTELLAIGRSSGIDDEAHAITSALRNKVKAL
ncbi:AMP-binding protein [Candidatus Omnitrophota bacterium]